MQEARRFGNDRLLSSVLPVLDNLDRALIHHDSAASHPILDGVRMVVKQFHDVLAGQGVQPFVSVGAEFDPERHQAIGREVTQTVAPGRIVQESQRGYTLHDRLLRPAHVTVAAAPTTASPDQDDHAS